MNKEKQTPHLTFESIDPGHAVRMLDAGSATAVDVREADEYEAGHIPGAVLLSLGALRAEAAAVLPEQRRPLVVYCRTGRRSAEACRMLAGLGYTTVYDLGGIIRWPYETEV